MEAILHICCTGRPQFKRNPLDGAATSTSLYRIVTRSSLYFANAVLLTAHEIDSAFWREWEMFRMPGGLHVFLILNLLLVAFMLHGYKQILLDRPTAIRWTLLLATAGGLAFIAHLIFLAAGQPEFRDPLSCALLGLIGILSLFQVLYEWRWWRGTV